MTESSPSPSRHAEAMNLIQSLAQAGLDIRPIPRAEESTGATLRQAIASRRGPTIFPGLADGWPARRTWTPGNLAQKYGHKQVTALMDLPANGILLPRGQRDYERSLPFADFITSMLAAEPASPCYLAYARAEGLLPEADYDFSDLTQESAGATDTRVWIGSSGTRSALHSDLKDNMFCQIWGEKLVVLVPWKYSRAVYPFPDNLVNSQVDLADLDLRRFPRLRSAVLHAGIVGPGDILFVPRGCWHDFSSLTPSISINHWFGPSVETKRYAFLLTRLGYRYWSATARDLLIHGVMRRPEQTVFFFSPPSTGKRLYNLLRWRDFSRDNDPTSE